MNAFPSALAALATAVVLHAAPAHAQDADTAVNIVYITPNEQCPAYERHFDEFRAAGVDDVVCFSVNDAFVMYQWRQRLGADRVHFVPDGSGHFTRGMGMMVNKDHLGFGERSWRYAMVVDDGVIRAFFEEPGRNDTGDDDDPYEVSDPETVLRWLAENPR